MLETVSIYPWSYDEDFRTVDSNNPKVSVCLTDMAGKTKYEAENDGKFIATSPESVEWLIEELEKAWGINSPED